MAAATQTHLLTYGEYLRTPEMMKRFEIIDGVMEFMSPAPTKAHQETLGELYSLLKSVSATWGRIYLAPFDIIISRKPLRTRQPDLFLVRKDRLHIVKDRIEEGPDIVVEILSPSNRRKDVLQKLKDYASIGVKECWMVDTDNRTLEIWRNEKRRFQPVDTYPVGQRVRSKVFPAFTLPATVFPKA